MARTTQLNTSVFQSIAGFWGNATGAGTTLTSSFNVTSITDTGTGQITFNIGTDFSDTTWASFASVTNSVASYVVLSTKAAGTILVRNYNTSAAAADPTTYYAIGFGTQ